MEKCVQLWQYIAEFFREWKIFQTQAAEEMFQTQAVEEMFQTQAVQEMFQTQAVQEISTHFIKYNFFFRKVCRLWDNEETYCTAGQATDDNMAHALCIKNN